MNKSEFIAAIAETAGVTKADTERVYDAMVKTIAKAVKKGDKITLVGFGSYSLRKRAARSGRNPRTGEKVKLKASRTVAFKAGAALKAAVS